MFKSNLIGSILKGTEHFFIAEYFKDQNKQIVYIARNDREIFRIKEKLNWLMPDSNILVFRSWDQIPYDKVSPSKEIQSERIKTLYQILNYKKNIILTSVNAIVQKTVESHFIKKNVKSILERLL